MGDLTVEVRRTSLPKKVVITFAVLVGLLVVSGVASIVLVALMSKKVSTPPPPKTKKFTFLEVEKHSDSKYWYLFDELREQQGQLQKKLWVSYSGDSPPDQGIYAVTYRPDSGYIQKFVEAEEKELILVGFADEASETYMFKMDEDDEEIIYLTRPHSTIVRTVPETMVLYEVLYETESKEIVTLKRVED